jgi:hypothetical protein
VASESCVKDTEDLRCWGCAVMFGCMAAIAAALQLQGVVLADV